MNKDNCVLISSKDQSIVDIGTVPNLLERTELWRKLGYDTKMCQLGELFHHSDEALNIKEFVQKIDTSFSVTENTLPSGTLSVYIPMGNYKHHHYWLDSAITQAFDLILVEECVGKNFGDDYEATHIYKEKGEEI